MIDIIGCADSSRDSAGSGLPDCFQRTPSSGKEKHISDRELKGKNFGETRFSSLFYVVGGGFRTPLPSCFGLVFLFPSFLLSSPLSSLSSRLCVDCFWGAAHEQQKTLVFAGKSSFFSRWWWLQTNKQTKTQTKKHGVDEVGPKETKQKHKRRRALCSRAKGETRDKEI